MKKKTKSIVKCSFCNGTGKRILETGLENMGHKLSVFRIEKGLTQAELAKKLGYSRTSITNLEAGRQDFPVHKLYEIASILGIDPKDLL